MGGQDNSFVQDSLFVVDAHPLVWWPAEIALPQDGGELLRHKVEFQLEYHSWDELQEEINRISELVGEKGAAVLGTEEDPLVSLVRDWRGFGRQGHEGPLPCTPETKLLLLKNASVRGAAITACVQMANGQAAKNSETPPAAGLNRAERRRAAAKTRRS